MKKLLFFILFIPILSYSQTVINLQKVNGVYQIPCKVNGLDLKFIFDTGASDVSISSLEASFMLKQGYLKESDILGVEQYQIANGEIIEGLEIILRKIEIGGIVLTNVKASVIIEGDAPLLLGQSAIEKLGPYQFDSANGTLTISNGTPTNNKTTYNMVVEEEGFATQIHHTIVDAYNENRYPETHFALHKTAKPGTFITIKNKMNNNNVTLVKVIEYLDDDLILGGYQIPSYRRVRNVTVDGIVYWTYEEFDKDKIIIQLSRAALEDLYKGVIDINDDEDGYGITPVKLSYVIEKTYIR